MCEAEDVAVDALHVPENVRPGVSEGDRRLDSDNEPVWVRLRVRPAEKVEEWAHVTVGDLVRVGDREGIAVAVGVTVFVRLTSRDGERLSEGVCDLDSRGVREAVDDTVTDTVCEDRLELTEEDLEMDGEAEGLSVSAWLALREMVCEVESDPGDAEDDTVWEEALAEIDKLCVIVPEADALVLVFVGVEVCLKLNESEFESVPDEDTELVRDVEALLNERLGVGERLLVAEFDKDEAEDSVSDREAVPENVMLADAELALQLPERVGLRLAVTEALFEASEREDVAVAEKLADTDTVRVGLGVFVPDELREPEADCDLETETETEAVETVELAVGDCDFDNSVSVGLRVRVIELPERDAEEESVCDVVGDPTELDADKDGLHEGDKETEAEGLRVSVAELSEAVEDRELDCVTVPVIEPEELGVFVSLREAVLMETEKVWLGDSVDEELTVSLKEGDDV